MKKEEIIYVRILTVIGASALMALILIFGAGSGLFQRIANGINDNTLQLSNVDAAIYSLYFYKGLDVLYPDFICSHGFRTDSDNRRHVF